MSIKSFILTDKEQILDSTLGWSFRSIGNLKLMVQGDFFERESTLIWYDGWILPRNRYFGKYRNYKVEEIIHELICNGVKDFHNYIKGNFTLVVLHDSSLTIMTDFHGLSKVYYRVGSNHLEYSNDYALIVDENDRLEDLFPFVLALFQHPVGGIMPHSGIRFIDKPTYVMINDLKVSSICYWMPESIIESPNTVLIDELVNEFQIVVQNTCEFRQLRECALTLTGGRDTRSVLSALQHTKVSLRPFTFGDPRGKDVLVAQQLSTSLNLNFTNPNINPLSPENYDIWVNNLMRFCNPFISLHRAHRLQAFSEMRSKFPDIDFLFMGCMGGDYSKGISFNDYIVTKFLRFYYIDKMPLEDCIKNVLVSHDLDYSKDILDRLCSFINGIEWIEKEWSKSAEMKLAFYFVGTLHDVQDMMLARYCGFHVFSPFMDIDFIEMQFKSEFCLYHSERNSVNPLNRLRGGELQARIICGLSKELCSLPLANDYIPRDILGNRILYLFKRTYKHFVKKPNLPTFSYGAWFVSWVRMKESLLGMNNFVENEVSNFPKHEGFWHKITNRIWIKLLKREIDVRNSKK